MIESIDKKFSGDDQVEQVAVPEPKHKGRWIRTVETMWNEPLEHACSWLPPRSPISGKDRFRYQSIRPIRLIADTSKEEYLREKAIFDQDGQRSKRAFEEYETLVKSHDRDRITLRIDEKGYHIRFANPGTLDFLKVELSAEGIGTLYRPLNGTVIVTFPYKAVETPWYRTWNGVWEKIRSLGKRGAVT